LLKNATNQIGQKLSLFTVLKRTQNQAVVLIKDLHTNVTVKHVTRIGKSTDGKNRPLKIVLRCEEEKVNLMGNLAALRGVEKYVGISITEDLTQNERNAYKETKTTQTQNTSGEFLKKRIPTKEDPKTENNINIKELNRNNKKQGQYELKNNMSNGVIKNGLKNQEFYLLIYKPT